MPKITTYSFITPLLTLLFLAVVSTMASFAINSIEKETKQHIRYSLQTVLQTTVTTYHIWIEDRKRDAIELASTTFLIEMTNELLTAEGDRKKQVLGSLRNFIFPKLAREKDLGFFIISPERISIGSMRDANLDTTNLIHIQRPDYLDRAFSGKTLFIPTLLSDVPLANSAETDNDRPLSIFVVSPIKLEHRVIAVLALRINLNTLFNYVPDLARLGDSGETYAFDKKGMLITKSRFDQQLQSIGLISPGGSSVFNIRITDPGGNLLEGYIPEKPPQQRPLTLMADSATRGQSGYNVNGYRDYRGVLVFGAWLWDHDLGFGITTEVDVHETLRSFYQTRRTVIAILSIIMLMALSLLAYVTQTQRAKKRYLQQSKDTLEQLVEERTRELNETKKELESANCELEVLATTDGLTSLANRRCFDSHLENEWLRCLREGKSLGIIIIDIDYFKNYNDHYGHPRGDECLSTVAHTLRKVHAVRRPGDLIARYGGEEFVIVLSDPTIEYVCNTANRLREQVYQLGIEHQASQLPDKIITISIGYAIETDLNKVSSKELFKKADTALFRAKSLGRNRTCQHDAIS
ncbi:sensor domain-containing diguanylate cyclase [Amphritea sp. HPY]|uniref:sensor domain-containing diguanylate cyclase n=1 Tax=Amphritea sp. HPY TaxID=3421652 RepID=UPI003D7D5E03